MELSEEEKEAIDYLKNSIESYVYLLNNDDKRKDYYIREYPNMEAERILLNLVENQQEKVKQLEKGNRSLIESRKKWKNRYYKEKRKNKEYINKTREKIENLNKEIASPFGARPDFQVIGEIKVLKELLGDEK